MSLLRARAIFDKSDTIPLHPILILQVHIKIFKILIYTHSYLKEGNDVQVASSSQSSCLFASSQAFGGFGRQHRALCTESMTRQDLKLSALEGYMTAHGNMNVLENSDVL